MRFHCLPSSISLFALTHLTLLPCALSQFTFPPPLTRPLTDYTTGAATPTMNFSAGDNMFGGWSTPGKLMSFLVYRCTGSTEPGATIKPSNSEFNSTEGHLAPDKTWEQMPLYSSAADMFTNGFNPGRNPIWFHGDFFANNKTTGDLCWFELYPGSDTLISGMDGQVRVATVNGEGDWYFATEPFTVKPARPSNLTVTWKESGPKPNIMKNRTDADMSLFYSEFPSMAKATESPSSGGCSIFLQGPTLMGCLAAALITLIVI